MSDSKKEARERVLFAGDELQNASIRIDYAKNYLAQVLGVTGEYLHLISLMDAIDAIRLQLIQAENLVDLDSDAKAKLEKGEE